MLIIDLSLFTDKPKDENCEGNLSSHAGHEITARERTTVQRTAKKVDDKCEKSPNGQCFKQQAFGFFPMI